MLYLRISWVGGQAGVGLATLIILLSSFVAVLTALSMCAICTNGEVKAGMVKSYFGKTNKCLTKISLMADFYFKKVALISSYQDHLGQNSVAVLVSCFLWLTF